MFNHTAGHMYYDISAIEELKREWVLLLSLGIGLIVLGIVALGSAFVATLASVIVFGWVLIIAGIVDVVRAFTVRHWRGFFVALLGILYAVVGVLVLSNPMATAVSLTLLFAALFFVAGIFRIVSAIAMRFENWGWLVASGVITSLLGVLIWQGWPATALWVIGMFVGIDLIVYGWWTALIALAARHLPRTQRATT